MEILNYLYDSNGEKTAIFINLKQDKILTAEEIEDIEDIIGYELSKSNISLDYNSEIEKLLLK